MREVRFSAFSAQSLLVCFRAPNFFRTGHHFLKAWDKLYPVQKNCTGVSYIFFKENCHEACSGVVLSHDYERVILFIYQ